MKARKISAFVRASQTAGPLYAQGYSKGLAVYLQHGELFDPSDVNQELYKRSRQMNDEGEGLRDGMSGSPPRGFTGHLGANNRFAGEKAKRERFVVRVTAKQKKSFKAKANAQGMSLSAWVLWCLSEAVEK